jgi:transposase
MEISTKTLQSDRSKHAALFVALELSKATWLVALNSPIADKISEHRIDGGDTAKLLALIEAKRLRAEGQLLGLPVRVMCCYEAGHDGF